MNATDLYKTMLRDRVGPTLRGLGFKGPAGKWTYSDPATGDLALVQSQSSQMSSGAEVWFTINLAVVPAPWWAWISELYRLKKPSEANGLWHMRLRPTTQIQDRGGDPWWRLHNAPTAQACGHDVVTQLQEAGIPKLKEAMHRPTLIDLVHRSDGSIRASIPEVPLAVILSDHGPSDELDQVLRQLSNRVDSNPSLNRDYFTRLADWVRNRAAAHTADRPNA